MRSILAVKPNPFYRRVRKACRDNPAFAKRWTGVVFRSVPLAFAKPEQIVDGMGAMKTGGRWNPPGRHALYCSLNPGTAAEESMRLFDAAGIRRTTVKPRLIVGIRYRLKSVIDLKEFVAAIEGADLAELLREEWMKINRQGWETQGQALGRALVNASIEGLLAPSVRVPGALNLVIFPKNVRRTSLQQVLEQKELQTWLK